MTAWEVGLGVRDVARLTLFSPPVVARMPSLTETAAPLGLLLLRAEFPFYSSGLAGEGRD